MAFQGTPQGGGVDPIQLAFMLLDRKREEQRARQDQMFARVSQMQNAQKFAQESQKRQLEILEKRANLAKALREESGPGIASAQRNAAAEFTPSDMEIPGRPADSEEFTRILMQNDPAGVERGVNAQALLADRVMGAARAQSAIGGVADPVSSVLGAADASQREAARQRRIRLEDAEQQARSTAEISAEIQAERNRKARERDMDPSRWTVPQIDSYREKVSNSAEFKLASGLEKQRAMLDRYDPNNNQMVFELMQAWQRNADEGAVVRGEDIQTLLNMNISGASALEAEMTSFFDENDRFPEGFGEKMGRMFEHQMNDIDRAIVAAANEIENDARDYGWSEAQKKRATPRRLAIQRARSRLAERQAPVAEDPVWDRARRAAAQALGQSVDETTPEQAAEFLDAVR